MILHFGRQRREKWFYVATRRCKWMCEDESFLCCCWSITSLSTNVEQRWMIYGGRGEENTSSSSSSSSTTLFRSWSMTLWRRLAKNSRLIAQRLKFQRRKKIPSSSRRSFRMKIPPFWSRFARFSDLRFAARNIEKKEPSFFWLNLLLRMECSPASSASCFARASVWVSRIPSKSFAFFSGPF